MNCFYSIQLPDGGEVTFSANFTKIAANQNLKELVGEYLYYKNLSPPSDLETQEQIDDAVKYNQEKISELETKIRSYTNTGLHHSSIRAILNSIDNNDPDWTDTFVNKVNAKIDETLNIDNVNDAIFKLLKKDSTITKTKNGVTSQIDLAQFLNELRKPINKKYFYKLNINNVIGMTSVAEQLEDFDSKIGMLESIGQDSSALVALKNILSITFPNRDGIRGNKIFFNSTFDDAINSSVVIKDPATSNPMFFYNDSNHLSIFLGLFGYNAAKVNPEALVEILNNYNSKHSNKLDLDNFDAEKFFLGYIDENDKYVDPEFTKILRFKTETRQTINAIIELTANELMNNFRSSLNVNEEGITDEERGRRAAQILSNMEGKRAEIIKNLQLLFKFISPDKYAVGLWTQTELDLKNFEEDKEENLRKTDKRKKSEVSKFITKDAINFHYSSSQLIDIDNAIGLQDWAFSSVRPYKDILVVPIDRNGRIISKLGGKSTTTINLVPTYIRRYREGFIVEKGFYSDGKEIVEINSPIIFTTNSKFWFKSLDNEEEVDYTPLRENAVPLKTQFPSSPIVTITKEVKDDTGKLSQGKTLPESLIKTLIQRGSTIKYQYFDKVNSKMKEATGTVKAVFPGRILLNTFKIGAREFTNAWVKYENVISFSTLYENLSDDFTYQEWSEKKELLGSLDRIEKLTSNYLPIKEGDYVKITEKVKGKSVVRYNKVLGVDDDNIYIIVKTQDALKSKTLNKVISQPRESISEVFTEKLPKMELDELKGVLAEFKEIYTDEQSVRNARYSYFLSKEQVKDGDFYIIPDSSGEGGSIFKLISKKDNYGVRISFNKATLQPGYHYEKANLDNASMFITKNDISVPTSLSEADINNFFIITANSEDDIEKYPKMKDLGFVLVPIKYVIPRFLSGKKSPELLPSGNYDIGSVRWGSKLDVSESNFIDVTDDLVQDINNNPLNKRHTKGKQLFIFRKDKTGSGYIKRYNSSLQEYILLDDKGVPDKNYNKFKDFIKPNVYFMFKKNWEENKVGFSNKLYKVVTVEGNKAVLEYTGLNNYGNPIIIRKSVDIEEAFKNKEFKAMYVMKSSDNMKALESTLDKSAKKKPKGESRIEFINYVSDKMANLFDIETKLVSLNPNDEENKHLLNKKAWIENDEETGNPVIVINMFEHENDKYNATATDVVHEYLHMFLIGLRYGKNDKLYNDIIEAYRISKLKGRKLSAFQVEEYLVNDLADQIIKNGYMDVEANVKNNLFQGILEVISDLSEDFNEATFRDLNINSLENLLTSKVSDVIKRMKTTSEIKNANLVMFDASFRDWLEKSIKDKSIKINCE